MAIRLGWTITGKATSGVPDLMIGLEFDRGAMCGGIFFTSSDIPRCADVCRHNGHLADRRVHTTVCQSAPESSRLETLFRHGVS